VIMSHTYLLSKMYAASTWLMKISNLPIELLSTHVIIIFIIRSPLNLLKHQDQLCKLSQLKLYIDKTEILNSIDVFVLQFTSGDSDLTSQLLLLISLLLNSINSTVEMPL